MAVFSGLLDSYAVRPTWQVAGVDYDVGTPSGTKLKDPSTIKMSGVSVNTGTHTITVSSSNVTLDGYDFSLNGGWQVSVINNANNVTIQNSYFKVGSNNLMPIDADRGGSVNVLHNTFEGGADTGSTVNSMFYTGAGAVVEYNRFTKFPNDAIDITHDGNYTIQYNLFDTMGTGAYHSDAIQTYFSDIQSIVVQYNTMYQPPNWTGPDEINAFFRIGDQQGHVVHNPVAAYNTIVMPSSGAPTSGVFQWGSGGAGTLVNPSIHDNFINPTGVRYSIVSTYLQDKTGVINPVTYNNIDMTTGKPLLSGQYENRSTGVPAKPPAAPVITTETAASSTQVKLDGTAQAGLLVDVYDKGVFIGTTKVAANGTWTFTTSNLISGEHVFTARATDAFTNSGALSEPAIFNVGGSGPQPVTAPTITTFSNDSGTIGDGITNDNTITLTGRAAANSTLKVFDGAIQIGTTTADASGAWSFTSKALTEGKHSLTATATSGSTTSPASTALALTIDTVAPTAPTMATSVTAAKAFAATNIAQLAGTAEANSKVDVYDGATKVATVTANSSGAWAWTSDTLTTGNHSFTAKSVDAAGNISSASAPVVVNVPAPTAPSAPTITTFSNDSGTVGDGITNDNTITLTGKAAANSSVKVFDGTMQIGTATADASGAWSFTSKALAEGKHSLTATATSGSTTSPTSTALALTIDTVAPTAPTLTISTSATALASTKVAQFAGTAEANSKIDVYDGATKVGTVTASGSGAWAWTSGTLATGSHSFTAKATDVAGNISSVSAAVAVKVQVPGTPTAPITPTIATFSNDSGVAGDRITNDNQLTLTGTAAANSIIKVFDGSTQVGKATANANGQWTLNTSALNDGGHNFTATATNASGVTSGSSSALAVTIDTKAPIIPTMGVYSQSGGGIGGTTSLDDFMLKGTGEANSTIKVFDGVRQIGTAVVNSSGAWSLNVDNLSAGAHNFTATATDVAGNASMASTTETVSIKAPAPTAGPIDFTSVSESWNYAMIKGTADPGSNLKLYDGNALVGTATAGSDGSWTFWTRGLSDQVHTFTAQAVDGSGKVLATSGGQAILGSSKANVLTGTSGDDYLFGNGSADTFVFSPNFGNDVIKDFNPIGRGHDTIQFSSNVFDSFASVLSHASQVGQDVVIASGQDTLTLKNVKLSSLSSNDFHFA